MVTCALSNSLVTAAGLRPVLPRAVGLQLFAQVHNPSAQELSVQLHPDRCCLEDDDAGCNVVELIGSASDTVPQGSTSSLQLVAPLLDPYARRGFCTIYLDYNSKSRPNKFIRDTIKIKFDTTLQISNAPDGARICKHIDEDPLNDCKPVYCDTYYNGRKSYFNVLKKRCVEVPTCLANANNEIPKSAYNPVSNKCVNKPAISKEDINFIKALTAGKGRLTKDILIIKTMAKNCSVSPDDMKADFESNTISKVVGVKTTTRPRTTFATNMKPKTISKFNFLVTYVMRNKHTLLTLIGVILVQCCLICTMAYCFMKSCTCCKKKEVINKFFNHHQDASVTTPLIGTSNIDTETTDNQYLSESSNCIDKKIRCYKACQKERKTSCKLSMSDDILSKCIARRDWRRIPRSETIHEVRIDDNLHASDHKEIVEQKNLTDTKVGIQDDKWDAKKPISLKSIVKRVDNRSNGRTLSDSSEKVIRCQSYNDEGSSNVMCFKKNGNGKAHGTYKQEKNTDSIEQGAQAYFSNDSIDDFLSERGVLFIGDNASKYSFSSMSSANNSTRSSKTSKNNVIRNVIPCLSRKGRGPSSDPGLNKSKPDLDLELLHISRVSMCSSTNDSDLCKDLKRIKDSTSSL